MNNQLQKVSFSTAITTDKFQKAINRTLQNPDRARRFTSSIITAVNTNPQLKECDAGTIVSAALLGESLNLSPSPQLGQYYLVPFNTKDRGKIAQFQLGYKGYMQLAVRSGQIKQLIAMEVKEGELKKYDPFNGIFEAEYIEDEERRVNTPTIGYYAMFELINGYRQILYWDKAKMEHHANTYSQGYKARKGYTFWEKNFDAMAKKTMIRQLISKGGCPMSIEMQQAYEKDMSVLNEDGTSEYIETNSIEIQDDVQDVSKEIIAEPDIGAMTEEETETMSLDEI